MDFDPVQKVLELANHLRGPIGLPPPEASTTGDGIDRQFVRFADVRHRVGPLLYKVQSQPECQKDSAAGEHLKNLYQLNVQQILQQKAAAKRIVDLLSAHEISCISLKGDGLAVQLHQDSAARKSRDVDILISPEDTNSALPLLFENGYNLAGDREQGNSLKTRLTMKVAKDISIRDPDFNKLIELHQRTILFEPKNFTAALKKSIGADIVPPITNNHYVLYLVVHGALSFWQRLHWLVDLSILVRKIDRDQRSSIIALSDQFHCKHAIVASLLFVEEIFPGSLDQGWQLLLRQYETDQNVTKTKEQFRQALTGNARGNILMVGQKTTLHSPSWHVFKGHMSFWGMLPRRLATLAMSKF